MPLIIRDSLDVADTGDVRTTTCVVCTNPIQCTRPDDPISAPLVPAGYDFQRHGSFISWYASLDAYLEGKTLLKKTYETPSIPENVQDKTLYMLSIIAARYTSTELVP